MKIYIYFIVSAIFAYLLEYFNYNINNYIVDIVFCISFLSTIFCLAKIVIVDFSIVLNDTVRMSLEENKKLIISHSLLLLFVNCICFSILILNNVSFMLSLLSLPYVFYNTRTIINNKKICIDRIAKELENDLKRKGII